MRERLTAHKSSARLDWVWGVGTVGCHPLPPHPSSLHPHINTGKRKPKEGKRAAERLSITGHVHLLRCLSRKAVLREVPFSLWGAGNSLLILIYTIATAFKSCRILKPFWSNLDFFFPPPLFSCRCFVTDVKLWVIRAGQNSCTFRPSGFTQNLVNAPVVPADSPCGL